MPKIGNFISSSEIPCDRCGNKRKVSKVWTEKLKNDHGVMIIRHSEIICTNADCQSNFDKKLKEEVKKRRKLEKTKLENAVQRQNEKNAAKDAAKRAIA